MKLLVLGQTGQVARELSRNVPTGWDVTFLGRDLADFANPVQCLAALKQAAPDMVINAVAYTAVDRAEDDVALATAINATTPGVLASECAASNTPFVHISTDYVFDGSGDAPRTPDAPTAPLGVYGSTKLAGEVAVRAANGPHAILRTSWVFSSHGANFVKTMRRLGAERDALTIVADQIGGPTPAADIARACLTMAQALHTDPTKSGTYHFSGTPDASWADFAREIFAQSNITCDVTDIPTSAYPTPAARPLNSRLDCSSTAQTFAIERPDWRAGLREVLNELTTSP